MQTNKLIPRLITAGTRLVLLASMLVTALAGTVTPAAAAPSALPRLTAVSVGSQTGTVTYGTPGSVTYLIGVTKVNSGGGNTTTANLSVIGLAGFSQCANAGSPGPCWIFSPASLNWSGNSTGTLNSTLTLKTGTASNAGSFNFTARAVRSQSPSDTASGTGSLAIAQASSTTAVTFEAGPYTYRGTAFAATAAATGAGGLNQSLSLTYSGDCTNVTVANGCSASATFAGDANHTGSSGSASITIAQANPAITFAAAPYAEYPGADFTVSATTSSDGTLTYSFVSGPCTLVDANAGIFTPIGTGTCVVQADTTGTTNFLAGSAQQQVTIIPPPIHLYAVAGSAPLPGATVTVWGYNSTNDPVTQPGGPTLTVNQGDTVSIALHNQLGEDTALLFQGQDMIPDTTGAAPGGTKLYTFTASRPGTYLYEAGLLPNAQHQVAMGLYGALVVRPNTAFASVSGANTVEDLTGTTLTDSAAAFTDLLVGGMLTNTTDGSSCSIASFTATTLTCAAPLAGGTANTWALDDGYAATAGANFAYGSITTAYDNEAVLVLSDIDPALNNSATPAAFDMRNFAPKYFLINGKVYPGTDSIPTTAGNTVLLRYVNAGLQPYSMSLLGVRQIAIATDGSPFAFGRSLVAETIAPGQTADMLASVPATAADGSKFALYDANLMLHNNKTNNNLTGGFGGMLTFLTVSGTPGTGDTTGPLTSGVSLTATSVSATISDAGRGDSDVAAAEFFIDTTGASGNGTAMDPFTPGVTVNVTGTINPALSGAHTVYVHGMDSAGNWGPFVSAVISNDTSGPTTSALTLSPNPSNGSANVALSASASDTASGGSNIAAGEYTIDGGTAVSMTVSPSGAKVASLTASIPAAIVGALPDGTHVVSVRSQDSLGNWGAAATINLIVDKTGPATSSVSAAPNPNNGTIPFNSSTPAVHVTATFTDALSKIASGEGFIDAVGANGTGFILQPNDGLFNSLTEDGYVNIPLTTIGALSEGNHTIYIHGRDAAGNWGATSTTILVIDKTAPTINSSTLTPSTIAFGAASTQLNVTATDTGTGVSGGQYWIDGTATPPANATTFTNASVAINTSALAAGTHIIYFQVKDVVGNWSAVSNATLQIVLAVNDTPTAITANGSTTQTIDFVAGSGVLANDEPIGLTGRTARIASAPVRTSGNGSAVIVLSCPTSLGTPATPAINGNTVCTNGAYRVSFTNVTGNNNNQRAASKRGTYTFTYTLTLNGVTSTATVTIIVQ